MCRVLMTADAVGGVWRYAIALGGALADRGVETHLAVMGPPPDAAQRRDAERAGLALSDRPYRLEWMDEPWADVAQAGGWLLELADAVQPDVVHLNGYAHGVLPWPVPVVMVAHSCVRTWWRAVRHEAPPARLDCYATAVRAGLAGAGLLVAPTAAMLAAIEDEYGAAVEAHVIPNGYEPRSDAADRAPGTREALVLAAGRVWDEAKNLAALCRVSDRVPWPVCVAGEPRSPDGGARELPGVRMLGRLPAPEMARWYRRASIYALPARYEPFGLSVLEAAAAGCALVLGDIDSLRENWDGAALFVPPDDAEALAAAVNRLIAHPSLRTCMGRRALERASAFTLDRTADEYRQVYDALAS